jgi:hypothetical protein
MQLRWQVCCELYSYISNINQGPESFNATGSVLSNFLNDCKPQAKYLLGRRVKPLIVTGGAVLSVEQIADIFTKPLDREKFEGFR